MLNMMADQKRKEPMGDLGDQLFDALKAGDKEGFKATLSIYIKEAMLDAEMESDGRSGEDLDD